MASGVDIAGKLHRLADKYRTLAELRARREALETEGRTRFDARESRMRRSAFKRVAREFPGALRELDATPAEVLRGRLEAVLEIQRAFECGARRDLPLWMELAIAYHDELREALAIKRWLSRRIPRGGPLDPPTADAFRSWYSRMPARLRPARALNEARLTLYLNPPNGRLQALVWESLELRFDRPRGEIERLIFGSAPLER